MKAVFTLVFICFFQFLSAQSIFDNYIGVGTTFSVDTYLAKETDYTVNDAPFTKSFFNSTNSSFGLNFLILQNQKLNIKAGFKINYLSRNIRLEIEQEQGFSNGNYISVTRGRTENSKFYSAPISFEYMLNPKSKNQLAVYLSAIPSFFKGYTYQISTYNTIYGDLNYERAVSNLKNEFALDFQLGIAYYIPTKYLLIQPFVAYKKGNLTLWNEKFNISNVQNRIYTEFDGTIKQTSRSIAVGLNLYPRKAKEVKKIYGNMRHKFKQDFSQNNLFDYYSPIGIHSSLDIFLPSGQVSYNQVDTPFTYSLYSAPGYSLGINRVVYSNKKTVCKVGVQYNPVPFADYIKIDASQDLINNQEREEWNVQYAEDFHIFSLPISYEYLFRNKKHMNIFYMATTAKPAYWKHQSLSYDGVLVDENDKTFRYNQEFNIGYYFPTKHVLFQPYLYYSQSFTALWQGSFTRDNIVNRPYTSVSGTFKNQGNRLGFGLNIYFKKR